MLAAGRSVTLVVQSMDLADRLEFDSGRLRHGPKAHVRTAGADSVSVPLAACLPLAAASPSWFNRWIWLIDLSLTVGGCVTVQRPMSVQLALTPCQFRLRHACRWPQRHPRGSIDGSG